MRSYWRKRECSVVWADDYGPPFAEFKQQRPVRCPVGPKEFTKTEDKYARGQIETNKIKSYVM